jgi:hypothetical protein
MSFGSQYLGSDFFGSDGDDGGIVYVVSAVAIDANTVEITMSDSVLGSEAATQASSYSSYGLEIYGVWMPTPTTIRLATSTHIPGTEYNVRILGPVQGANGESLGLNWATFTAGAVVARPLVRNLKARTNCMGRRIDLSWDVPQGTEWVRIVRSEDNPILDLTDPHVVIYNGTTVTNYSDTGLEDDKFYYYTVLLSNVQAPPDGLLYFNNESKVEALSIHTKYWQQSKEWITRNTPNAALELDATDTSAGGGGGFLDKINVVLACAVALIRGRSNMAVAYTDPTRIPFSAIQIKLANIGLQPEGMSYDLSVPRRMLTFGQDVFRQRGTVPGIRKAVHMLTGWDCQVIQIGLDSTASRRYGSSLTTYNGKTKKLVRAGGTITRTPTTMQDSLLMLQPGAWKGGTVTADVSGDTVVIADNTNNTLTFETPEAVGVINNALSAGDTTFTISPASAQIKKGMSIQLTNGSDYQVVDVDNVSNTGLVTICMPIKSGGFPPGTMVSIGLSVIRGEVVQSGNVVYTGGIGYYISVSPAIGKTVRNRQFTANPPSLPYSIWVEGATQPGTILSNSRIQIFFNNNGTVPTGTRRYAICRGTYGGSSFATRTHQLFYTMWSGQFTTLYTPLANIAKIGSKYEVTNKLIHGKTTYDNTWGEGDLVVYLNKNIPVLMGQAAPIPVDNTGAFVLDVQQPQPASDSLVGYYLNPNQSQTELVRITGNTATRIFTETNVASLAAPENYYYVLSPRDAAKFTQLSKRITSDFSHSDIAVRFLFN